MALASGTRIAHYEIRSKLGEGGMGEVYLARDTKLGRSVALKLLPEKLVHDRYRLQRFLKEAQAASAINHPNVCIIHEVGESLDGRPFIAMEYIEGVLSAKIRGQALPSKEVVDIGIQVADALSEAHTNGIIHRDIKPSNIAISRQGQAKVLDFGLARISPPSGEITSVGLSTQGLTETGILLGTVDYMSPEQALGRHVDRRSDIFSFGVVLFEMATGQRPFSTNNPLETIDRITHAAPKPISQLNPKISSELQRIISKCLEKDPKRRYQSARELMQELIAQKQEVRPALYRRLTMVLSLLSALLVSLVGFVWLYRSPESHDIFIDPQKTIPFTSFPGLETQPALSPDGQQVAFAWNGEHTDNFDIYVKQIDSGSLVRLTTHPSWEGAPCWSPDGRRLAFLRKYEDQSQIMLIAASGGPERRLVGWRSGPAESFSDRWLESLSWSSDGKFLAMTNFTTDGDSGLLLVSVETGERKTITNPSQGLFDVLPAFSPDGQSLAFVRCISNSLIGDIYLASLAAPDVQGSPRRVTFDNMRTIHGFSWSADSGSIVFSSNRGGSQSLWRVPVGVGEPQRLTAGSVNATHLRSHGTGIDSFMLKQWTTPMFGALIC